MSMYGTPKPSPRPINPEDKATQMAVYNTPHLNGPETKYIPRYQDTPKQGDDGRVFKDLPQHEVKSHRSGALPMANYTKKSHAKGIMIAVAAFCLAALVVLGLTSLFTGGNPGQGNSPVAKIANKVVPDSGVEACKTITANMAKPTPSATSDSDAPSKPWTKAEFDQKNDPFKNSRYSDIKVAGTNLIGFMYNESIKISKMSDEDSFGEAMVVMTQLPTYWGQLQVACGNHGVTVGAMPMS